MSNRIIYICTVFLIIVTISIINSCKKEVTKGSIEGTITDAVNSQPVNGVTVNLSPKNTSFTTGSDGKYNFNDITEGDYSIQASKIGYQSNTKDVTVLAGQTRKGDIAITPNVPLLSVNVTSLDFGSNLTTLPIEIRNTGAASLDWTITENTIWLSINPISGNTTTQVSYINVTVDRTGLSQGNYAQSFSITSNGGNATIIVNLNVANPNAPTVTCAIPINISQSTAEVSGNITSIGSSNVTQHGHCWSTNPNPTTSDNISTLGPTTATGTYTSQLSGLMPNTTYYVRAYATNSSGTGYSTTQLFTTTSTPTVPSLTCDAANNITQTTADVAGAISNLGSGGVTEHGHCWSTSSNPTTSSYKTTLGATTSTGSFTSNLTNLASNTTYYVKSYATNSAGTGYSSEVSFTTTTNPTTPTVTTGSATNITLSSADVEGNITSIGSSSITQHGHCWSTSLNPTVSDLKTTLGSASGTGTFSSSITGLNSGTTYHVRAYATNSAGTSYGSGITLTTITPTSPTVTTGTTSNITLSSADVSGNITSIGTSSIIQHGHCWSISPGPTTSNSKTNLGSTSGTGTFSSNLTGLSSGATYYVRAYATNSTGTSYGSDVSVTTISPTPPSVTTGAISNITMISATANGSITSIGTSNVIQYGHCWSTNINPTTSDSKTQLGTGVIGSFNSNLTGLTAGTSYYVRAYATNSDGTSYGTQQSFSTTFPSVPTLITTAASGITGNAALSGGSISSDGGASITAKGVCWSTSQNPTTSNQYTNDGTGTNSFSSSITGLSPMTTYYARAYAINSAGTAYGNQVSFTSTLSVGQTYAGGIVFYIDGTGQHGLIAAPSDQGTGISWGCEGTLISGADGTAIGTGNQNTIDIVSGCSTIGIAAQLCANLVLNGYSDWYLPSKDELSLMFQNKTILGINLTGTPYYYSSSEYNASNAYMMNFQLTSGSPSSYSKSGYGYCRARAIRSF